MEFVNINTAEKYEGSKFEEKTRITGVGFVTLGQRIRGLLVNNKLDLSGVNSSDDYDDLNQDNSDWKNEKDFPYDETQDFMDKLDLADKIDTISERIEDNLSEQVAEQSAKAKRENKESVSENGNERKATEVDSQSES